MERFHFTIKQKLEILDLVKTGQVFRLTSQFPNVTQKQIDDWASKENEMRALSPESQATKCILHKGPSLKYKELEQFLYQQVKDMRNERLAITVDCLIALAEKEDDSIARLSRNGKISFIQRFMSRYKLAHRTITGNSGFRVEQASEEQKENLETFLREYKRIIIQKRIPIENVFNMDQTSAYYENPPTRTIDFAGSKEIAVKTQGGEKKRVSVFSLLGLDGTVYPQMVVYKGARNARIAEEVAQYDDWFSWHVTQENAWCDEEVLEDWVLNQWWPLSDTRPGPKLLIVDSYPLHVEFHSRFARYNTDVLYIPAGLTFSLQPLDLGFHKILKDELRKKWVKAQEVSVQTEPQKRLNVSNTLKEVWDFMANYDNQIFWQKAGLRYPHEEMMLEANRAQNIDAQERMEEEGDRGEMIVENDQEINHQRNL